MSSFNKVILLGNLTRDPELRVTASGLSICKLGLAVNRRFKAKDGEQKEEVTFVDVDSFGRQAETISKYFSKGKPILVEGRLKLDQWANQEGEKRSKMGVVLEQFQFVSGQGDGEPKQERRQPDRQNETTQYTPDRSQGGGDFDEDQDVPF